MWTDHNLHDWDVDEDPYEEAVANCGQLPDGTCMLAGSEYCDFECPFRD
jgi:hypothetical protein